MITNTEMFPLTRKSITLSHLIVNSNSNDWELQPATKQVNFLNQVIVLFSVYETTLLKMPLQITFKTF